MQQQLCNIEKVGVTSGRGKGTSACRNIAADDLFGEWLNLTPQLVCQPAPKAIQQQLCNIEKVGVTSGRGKGTSACRNIAADDQVGEWLNLTPQSVWQPAPKAMQQQLCNIEKDGVTSGRGKGTSACRNIAADDLFGEWLNLTPQLVCQPAPKAIQQQLCNIEKVGVTSGRGKGTSACRNIAADDQVGEWLNLTPQSVWQPAPKAMQQQLCNIEKDGVTSGRGKGTSACRNIAADDLFGECLNLTPQLVCQPAPKAIQQQLCNIEKVGVTSGRGKGTSACRNIAADDQVGEWLNLTPQSVWQPAPKAMQQQLCNIEKDGVTSGRGKGTSACRNIAADDQVGEWLNLTPQSVWQPAPKAMQQQLCNIEKDGVTSGRGKGTSACRNIAADDLVGEHLNLTPQSVWQPAPKAMQQQLCNMEKDGFTSGGGKGKNTRKKLFVGNRFSLSDASSSIATTNNEPSGSEQPKLKDQTKALVNTIATRSTRPKSPEVVNINTEDPVPNFVEPVKPDILHHHEEMVSHITLLDQHSKEQRQNLQHHQRLLCEVEEEKERNLGRMRDLEISYSADKERLLERIRVLEGVLNEKDQALTQQSVNLSLANEELEKERASVRKIEGEANSRLRVLRSDLKRLQSELQDVKAVCDMLEQQLSEKEVNFRALQANLGQAQQARQRLEEELLQSRRTCVELEKGLQQNRETLEREREVYEQRIRESERTLVDSERRVGDLQSAEPRDWIIRRDEVIISEKVLGTGGWGNVYQGSFRGCDVAVKQIHDLILSAHNRRLFEREMSIASRCRHPNLLQFIGATNDDGSPLFVTELLDTDLRKVLSQRSLYHEEIVCLALDVAIALNYLHLNKPLPILHRDISSSNVLLWRRGDWWRAKLSDYGAANFMRQCMTSNPGARIYAAPEALTSQQSPKIDVYSFGSLLCEMCIRQLPDPEWIQEQAGRVTNGVLRELVIRCVMRAPDARSTMNDVITVLIQQAETLNAQELVTLNGRTVTL